MKNFCKLLLITLLMISSAPATSNGQINAMPKRFIFQADRPVTREIIVTNPTTEPMRVRVSIEPPANFPEKHYLGDWMVVYPPMLSIPPQQRRTIRFSVRPPAETKREPGEYRAVIYLAQQASDSKLPAQDSQSDKIQLGFQILTRLGLHVYGGFGELTHSGQASQINVVNSAGQLEIKGNFENKGNAHLRMTVNCTIQGSNGNTIGKSEFPLLVQRYETKEFSHPVPLETAIESGSIELSFTIDDKIIHNSTHKF